MWAQCGQPNITSPLIAHPNIGRRKCLVMGFCRRPMWAQCGQTNITSPLIAHPNIGCRKCLVMGFCHQSYVGPMWASSSKVRLSLHPVVLILIRPTPSVRKPWGAQHRPTQLPAYILKGHSEAFTSPCGLDSPPALRPKALGSPQPPKQLYNRTIVEPTQPTLTQAVWIHIHISGLFCRLNSCHNRPTQLPAYILKRRNMLYYTGPGHLYRKNDYDCRQPGSIKD